MTTDLDIVALAARTPVGLTAESSAAAVRAGVARLQEFAFVDPTGEPIIVGKDAVLGDDMPSRERLSVLAESVLDELLPKLEEACKAKLEVDLYLALPQSRPGVSDDDIKAVAQRGLLRLHQQGLEARVHIGGRGHSGALASLQTILERRGNRGNTVSIVLGVDSYINIDTMLWLESAQRLSQPRVRSGFVPGEAAAGFVLMPRALRRSLRLPGLATLHGVGLAVETLLRDSETGSLGVATAQAVRAAATGLSLPDEAADAIYCDINGERYRSEDWGFFALRGASFTKRPEYIAPSDCWGDVGSAFAALGVVLAVEAFARAYAPGPMALVMAGSDDGERGAAFLRAIGSVR